MAGAGATPAVSGTRSSPSRSESEAEGFAALMAFGWLGENQPPPPPTPRFSGGDQLTAFDGEREVAEQDARRQHPGQSRQGLSQGEMARTQRETAAGGQAQRISEAKSEPPAAQVSDAQSEALVAEKSRLAAEKVANPATTAAPLLPPPNMRQMRLQSRQPDEGSARKEATLSAAQAAEKFSAAKAVTPVASVDSHTQDADKQQVVAVDARAGMSSASSEGRMPVAAQPTLASTTAQSGSAVASAESTFTNSLVERVNQIVTAMAQSPQQQVMTRLSLEGGEEMGVVLRLRDSQLEVRFVTQNADLKNTLNRGWERVQSNGQRYGLRISSPVFVDPSTTDLAS